MAMPEKVISAAQRLKEGHRINRITVRDFLRHFGAERRGAAKVQAIRSILDSLDLQTDPDFATAWIDGLIWLRLKEGTPVAQPAPTSLDGPVSEFSDNDLEEIVLEATPSAVKQAEEQAEAALSLRSQTRQIAVKPSRVYQWTTRHFGLGACLRRTRNL